MRATLILRLRERVTTRLSRSGMGGSRAGTRCSWGLRQTPALPSGGLWPGDPLNLGAAVPPRLTPRGDRDEQGPGDMQWLEAANEPTGGGVLGGGAEAAALTCCRGFVTAATLHSTPWAGPVSSLWTRQRGQPGASSSRGQGPCGRGGPGSRERLALGRLGVGARPPVLLPCWFCGHLSPLAARRAGALSPPRSHHTKRRPLRGRRGLRPSLQKSPWPGPEGCSLPGLPAPRAAGSEQEAASHRASALLRLHGAAAGRGGPAFESHLPPAGSLRRTWLIPLKACKYIMVCVECTAWVSAG